MTGERWVPAHAGERPPSHRKAWFEHWIATGVSALGVSYARYVELREAGAWNEYAREKLGGRFTVEEES
jgi:hypothetical protein